LSIIVNNLTICRYNLGLIARMEPDKLYCDGTKMS